MSHSLLLFLPLFFFIITTAAAVTNISDFPNCLPTDCNGFNISYPFWKIDYQASPFCGYKGLGINCSPISGEDRPTPMMYFGGNSYYVRNLTNTSITLVDLDFSSVSPVQSRCPKVDHIRIEQERLPLYFTSKNVNLSFHFNCTGVFPSFAKEIPCFNNGSKRSCVNVIYPETENYDWRELRCDGEVITTVIHEFDSFERLGTEFVDALRRGFELNWTRTSDDCEKCEESGGLCGYNHPEEFICFCSGGTSTKDHCKAAQPNISDFQNCPPSDCNGLNISYPFWKTETQASQFCGYEGLGINCLNIAGEDRPMMYLGVDSYYVRKLTNTSITLVDDDVFSFTPVQNECPTVKHRIDLEKLPLNFTSNNLNLSFHFNCVSVPPFAREIPCLNNEGPNRSCVNVILPDTPDYDWENMCGEEVITTVIDVFGNSTERRQWTEIVDALRRGFELNLTTRTDDCEKCEESGGLCGYNHPAEFICFCSSGTSTKDDCKGDKMNLRRKVLIAGISVIIGVCLMGVVFYFYWRRRNKKERYYASSYMSRKMSSYGSSVTDPENSEAYHGVQIFKYKELEKATNHFDSANELGDGGFGTVYQGKLKDGRVVAVKRLYENNYKRVEQFMNEIGIIAHLRHQNLVSLYGCTTHHSRELLLVYEYIPNGTVADHLHGDKSKPGSLTWTTRMSIAIETASALVYLHASDVVHRDVKTNNILLDNSFTVKVADFGLSRLFPTNVTHVSTAPQGTPGYVDPEYHNCYQLTNRSDVYSFGVVLIELISSKPAVDITRHRHEINLSNMALNKIRNDELHELVDPNLGYETDYEVRKMISAVAELAFQCLQNERDLRPSMDEVLKGLIGIQNGGNNYVKQDAFDGISDDAVLLKDHSQTMSPDSVAIAWSTSTISSSNG